MNRPDVQWVLWWVRGLPERAGLPLLLGCSLLAAALMLQITRSGVIGEIEVMRSMAPAASAPTTPNGSRTENDARLAEFHAVLPARREVPDILEMLFRLGAKQGVTLARGDYRLEEEAGGLVRCHIRFPVAGDAGSLEAFVQAALRRFPTLALEGIRLQRESALQSTSEVEIRFVLFLRPGTAPATPGAAAS